MDREAAKDTDRLLAGLDHADEAVRLESLRGIAHSPGAPALRILRKSARGDTSPTVRAEALRLLADVADRLSGTDLSGDSTRSELLVSDPDPGVRAQAVAALTMSFDARVPEILMNALESEQDPTVLETLIQAVASEGPTVAPKLIRFLSHDDPRVRAAAVEVLGDTKDDSLLTHLVPLLEDRNERVRVAAVRSLRSARQEAVLACVDEMLKRTAERDVRAALYVLRYFASAISVPRLAPRLSSNAPPVAAMARASLSSLAKKGSKRAKRALEKAGMDSAGVDVATISGLRKAIVDPKVQAAADERFEAMMALIQSGKKEQLPGVRGRLDQETDPRVLSAMIQAIGQLGGPGDVPLMASFLGHKRSRVRAAAVKAVNQLDRLAVSMLMPALRDRSSRVRAQAILCLADAKGINVMGSLKQMATSRDPRVVLTAVWTAAKIKVEGAKDVLLMLTASTDPDVRAEARRALGKPDRPPSAGRSASGPLASSPFIESWPAAATEQPTDAPATARYQESGVIPPLDRDFGSSARGGDDDRSALMPPGADRDESVLMPPGVDDNVTVMIEGAPPAESELYAPPEPVGPPKASSWGPPAAGHAALGLNTHRIPKGRSEGAASASAVPARSGATPAPPHLSSLLPGGGLSLIPVNETYMGEPIAAEPSGLEESAAAGPFTVEAPRATPPAPARPQENDRAKANALADALAAAQVAQNVRDVAAAKRADSVRLGPTNRGSTRTAGPTSPERKIPVGAVAGIAAVAAAVTLFALMPPSPPPPPPPPVVVSAAPPPPPTPTASVAPPKSEELHITFAPMAVPPPNLINPPEQSLEEVEAAIKNAHASRGITSKPIIHLMALDFMQPAYRLSIARAREMADNQQFDPALAELDSALEKLPVDHLTGRVAVMRAQVTIAREGEKFDRLRKYRQALVAEQLKLIELATEAAKDGGLRDHELKNLLARVKEAEKQKAEATRSADWLSGDNMFSDQPGASDNGG